MKALSDAALPDYTAYALSRKQHMLAVLCAAGGVLGGGWVFYGHWLPALLLMPAALYAPKLLRAYLLRQRRQALQLGFKHMLFSLSSSLSAGRSVENAFREAEHDLQLLNPGGAGDMIAELRIICVRLEYGQPVEEALRDFGRRSGLEDVGRFADVFSICKRTGGDLVEVVRRTSGIIGEKLEIEQEISVMIAQKKFESRALLVSPFALVLFMNTTAGDYMEGMRGMGGFLISTLALAGMVGCGIWISKIMDISL